MRVAKLCVLLACVSLLRLVRSKNLPSSDFDGTVPEQIHLSFGSTTDEIVVVWSTTGNATGSDGGDSVRFGLSSTELNTTARAVSWQFTEGNPNGVQWLYRAALQNLAPGSSYYYQVQSGPSSSPIFSFSVPKVLDDAYPFQVVMFGDMGKVGGSPTLPHLYHEARSGDNVALIHVGDFAYDMQSDGGKRGDDFMRLLQNASAYIPYMTCPGNHEIAFNFSHYRNRFSMPTTSTSPENDRLWWSMDIGSVHFVSYDTEVYFAREDLIQDQLDFLNKDLAAASAPEQRKKVPWIVAFGHRPMYCSNIDGDDCTTPESKVRAGLEAVLNKYGVDFIVEGHEHSYERMYPVFNETVTQTNYINPKAPVHFISGEAGCNEGDGVCVNPIKASKGKWSAFRSWKPGMYGYGRLKFFNATHAQWSQIVDISSQIEDTVTIVQENHGPFV